MWRRLGLFYFLFEDRSFKGMEPLNKVWLSTGKEDALANSMMIPCIVNR